MRRLVLAFVMLAGCKGGSAGPEPAPGAEPIERAGVVARGDQGLTLIGQSPAVGEKAPPFVVRDSKLAPVSLDELRKGPLVISVVPSIDTRVCEVQTHKLSDSEPTLPEGVSLITVSRDLPFAQTRFLEEAQMKTRLLSDYHEGSFGENWGLVVKETGLLARSVWLLAADGTIAYSEIVADQGTEPDYDALRSAIEKL